MPKLVDHASYRKHLLEQCMSLFAQYGYGALTMRQIAEALHVSTGTLYHYFPTKETLFQYLVEEITRQTLFEATSLFQGQTTTEERLISLFQFIADHEDTLRQQFLILLNYYQHREFYGEAAGAVLKEGAWGYQRAIMQLLDLSDAQLCLLLQNQIHGLLMLRMIKGTKTPLLEQARPFITMFMDYLHKQADSEDRHTEPLQASE